MPHKRRPAGGFPRLRGICPQYPLDSMLNPYVDACQTALHLDPGPAERAFIERRLTQSCFTAGERPV